MKPSPTLVILGASGDLVRRLMMPALYHLHVQGQIDGLRVVGYALEPWSEERFREHVRENLARFAPGFSDAGWAGFQKRLAYRSGDLSPEAIRSVAAFLDGPALFYLALPPSVFATAADAIAGAGLNDESRGWRRLLVEKPFGTDLGSAQALNLELHKHWREGQIMRIDHFLGKETVQNMLVFRFANRFLEPVWNAANIAQVQITAAETLGVEGRAGYYDRAGALRDMLQNHLLQLLAVTAIEPPSLWEAETLREHKVEVLKSVRPLPHTRLEHHAARGRYAAGRENLEPVPGYLEEPGVPPGSRTETFAALKLKIDNWRWKGVPFYLRSGKRLAHDLTEIAVQFREPPTRLFHRTPLEALEANWLVFRIKPLESVDLIALAKRPGLALQARSVTLHTPYIHQDEVAFSAYEQLLQDALEGDCTHFLRFDEVEWAWRIVQPVLDAWGSGEPDDYPAGSDGPASQAKLLEDNHRWRSLG